MGQPRLRFELFGEQHLELRTHFDCGVAELNRYLAERARKENIQGLARVHILYDPAANRIAGYYTLSALSVRFNDVPEHLTKRLTSYPELPATLIGRLAADSAYKGQGLGRLLVMDALAAIVEQQKTVASFLVIVDAKDEGVVAFYEKFAFQRLPAHPRRLFLPVVTIADLLPG